MAGGISESDFKKYLAEAIGAFFLTMGGMLAIIGTGDIVAIAAAHGAILGLMIYLFGSISGGHFNPAVSFALFVQKKLSQRDLLLYIVFQIMGATIGAFFAVAAIPVAPWSSSAQSGATLGLLTADPNPPNPTFSPAAAFMLEILMTFMLASTVSAIVAGGEKWAQMSGALIGGTLFACILWGGAWTGASLNPARSIGPALVSGTNQVIWASLWVYIAGPILGGGLAAVAFMWFRGDIKIHLTSSQASAQQLPPPPPPAGLPPPPSTAGLPPPLVSHQEPPKPPSL